MLQVQLEYYIWEWDIMWIMTETFAVCSCHASMEISLIIMIRPGSNWPDLLERWVLNDPFLDLNSICSLDAL